MKKCLYFCREKVVTAAETEEAVETLYKNLVSYLSTIEVLDSIDISFIIDDAELDTGAGWEGLPQLTNGMIYSTNTSAFTATSQIPVKMPKGGYGLLVRGYQRPGVLSATMKDYVNGTNNVKAYMTLNNKTQMLKHIAQGGTDTKLNQGGSEISHSGIYVPINNEAIAAYFNAGRYDNLLTLEQTAAKVMTIGVKQTKQVENDLLVIDGFKLFYYGVSDLTAIRDLETEQLSNEVEGYYNLNGARVSKPVRGIIIIKYKDGRSEKVFLRE
ncbi:MAG: hypothetical protein J5661_00035 [Bacteroidaceae bacterium]|nr:hypothetical protein [Bacteroidaceae bacterium]